MKYIIDIFALALKKIWRNKLLNVFIIFQIGLSICISYLVYGMLVQLKEKPRVYKNFYDSNVYYIAPRADYGKYFDMVEEANEKAMQPYMERMNSNDITKEEFEYIYNNIISSMYDELSEDVSEFIKSIPNLKKIYSYESNQFITDGVNNVIFMSRDIARKMNYKMQDGKWLTDIEADGKYLPVVVNSMSTYNVNDTIELEYTCRDCQRKCVMAVVVGKTEEKSYFSLQMTVGGSYSFSATDQLDSIISQSSDFTNSPFMCIYDDNAKKILGDILQEQETKYIIELQDGLSEEKYRETQRFFQDNGIFFFRFDDLYENSLDDISILLRQKSVLIGCAILISFIGLISFIILHFYNDKKINDIYRIVGMNVKESFILNLFYAVIMIVLALVIFLMFIGILGFIDYNEFINSYSYNYYISNGISFDVRRSDFINIPYEYIFYALSASGAIFSLSAFISYLLVRTNNKR